jgi:hypothetical protein
VLRALLILKARRALGTGFKEFRDAVEDGWKRPLPPEEPPIDEAGVREPGTPRPTPGSGVIELPEPPA